MTGINQQHFAIHKLFFLWPSKLYVISKEGRSLELQWLNIAPKQAELENPESPPALQMPGNGRQTLYKW